MYIDMYCIVIALYNNSIQLKSKHLKYIFGSNRPRVKNKTRFINLLICCLNRPIYVSTIKGYKNPGIHSNSQFKS